MTCLKKARKNWFNKWRALGICHRPSRKYFQPVYSRGFLSYSLTAELQTCFAINIISTLFSPSSFTLFLILNIFIYLLYALLSIFIYFMWLYFIFPFLFCDLLWLFYEDFISCFILCSWYTYLPRFLQVFSHIFFKYYDINLFLVI